MNKKIKVKKKKKWPLFHACFVFLLFSLKLHSSIRGQWLFCFFCFLAELLNPAVSLVPPAWRPAQSLLGGTEFLPRGEIIITAALVKTSVTSSFSCMSSSVHREGGKSDWMERKKNSWQDISACRSCSSSSSYFSFNFLSSVAEKKHLGLHFQTGFTVPQRNLVLVQLHIAGENAADPCLKCASMCVWRQLHTTASDNIQKHPTTSDNVQQSSNLPSGRV